MLLARRLTFRSRLVRSGCTFAEVAICGSERTGAVIVSPLSRLGDEVIQQQQYDQGVPRKGLFPLQNSGTYAHALHTQHRQKLFLSRLPCDGNASYGPAFLFVILAL